MDIYYNTATGEYPRHIGDLQLLGWSKGTPLPENWVRIRPTEPPTVGNNEVAYEAPLQQVDGEWIRQWAVREMTAEEIERRDNPLQDPTKNPL